MKKIIKSFAFIAGISAFLHFSQDALHARPKTIHFQKTIQLQNKIQTLRNRHFIQFQAKNPKQTDFLIAETFLFQTQKSF
ncbi:hypothetical protein SAMN02745152_00786 [Treponema berlinense]|uniref:Uncharacterized protein n=1 Tax=Treponema berlinense TaxID=225004 RepID=A0A1T4M7Y9_9SPIR|nr:hypothetical protein SAMN02745152_00786 [Treponema berlinense]